MRILHTADWHLGKALHGLSLLEDQAHVLDQILDLARELQPDAMILAGDVYDRSVPPGPAVELFSETLERIRRDLQLPVLLVAGNHDSPERLAFAHGILAESGIFVAGRFSPGAPPVSLGDEQGPIDFHLLPYLHPLQVRTALAHDSLATHDTATRAALETLRPHLRSGARHVAVAHAFVAGGEESESERPLTVGGSGAVPSSLFEPFQFTALGHLHAPQQIGSPRLRYAGSPLKYSFSEVHHRKSVSLVELDAAGNVSVEAVALNPRRDVRIVEGKLDDLLAESPEPASREDYLLARLTDTTALLDPMGRLRERYPNLLQIERPLLQRSGEDASLRREDLKQDDLSLFRAFFQQVTGEELDEDQAAAFTVLAQGAAWEP